MGNTDSCYNACANADADTEGRRPGSLQHKRRQRQFMHRDTDADLTSISNQLLTALEAQPTPGSDRYYQRPGASPEQHLPMAPDGRQAPALELSGALPLFAHEQKGNTRPVATEAHSLPSKTGGAPAPQKAALDVPTLMSPMGFLLDQPDANGPIFIAEVDEQGSARKLLKHPSIMLFEGDQILEVNACEEMGEGTNVVLLAIAVRQGSARCPLPHHERAIVRMNASFRAMNRTRYD